MKYSLKWLNEYVAIGDYFSQTDKLASLLTQAGLEVEMIEDAAKQFQKVVVGEILERGQHPNADRLTLCKVSTGKGVVHQIVCGAKNHKAGDKIVVALPGAVLPGNFEIKISKIRNVESMGMLCSERELGLSAESEGIMILPNDAPIGKAFAEYKNLDDIFFEVKITPNRADCLSHFGLAREIASLLKKPYEFPIKSFNESSHSTQKKIKLVVNDKQKCPRYTGRYLAGVKIAASPDWLKKRVESLGLNSINNVVDITNYVMLELGQPLHAFDADQISAQQILVDASKAGEKFTTFDKTEITLTGEELVIRDGQRPVALAGVIGGLNSGVTEKTKNIFLESAYFAPAAVRRASRKFGIETDSAYRFSRGVDPEAVLLAMNRATEMIAEIAGGEIYSDPYDVYPAPLARKEVRVATDFIQQQLGIKFSDDEFIEKMKSLGCEVNVQYDGIFLLKPPSYRGDLEYEIDFAEEYARLVGYEQIPEHIPVSEFQPTPHHQTYNNESLVHQALKGQGFQQAINYAFIKSDFSKEILGSEKKLSAVGLNTAEPVKVLNPLNEDVNVMRTALTPGLIKNLDFNNRHGNSTGRLYEVGYVFAGKDHFTQEARLAMIAWGKTEGLWHKNSVPVVFEMKSAMESLIHQLRGRNWQWQNCKDAPDFLHPGQSAVLSFEGKDIGFIGTLHPKLQDKLKLRSEVVLAEFNLDRLTQGQPRTPKYSKLPKFAAVERDLAFIVPLKLTSGEIQSEIKKVGGKLIQEVSVFDVFQGGNLPDGHRSIAFRYKVQDPETTLSDEALLDLQKKIIDSVSQKFSIAVR